MKKGDKILGIIVGIILIISLIGVLGYQWIIQNGTEKIAVIKQDGEVIERIDLNKVTETKQWTVEYKGHYNIIQVEPSRIRFLEADCPDQVCVLTGWIEEPGDIAVCLPNKLMIEIQGEKEELDGTTF